MVSYPIEMPTKPGFSDVRLFIFRNQSAHRSASGKQQIHRHPGDRWQGTLSLPPLNKSQASEWLGFLDALGGMQGTFMLSHPEFTAIKGTAASEIGSVDGAGQMGSAIQTSGWPASQQELFKRGDIIQIGNKLKKITADVDSDNSGQALLTVSPEFSNAPENGAIIITESPAGEFRLMEPNVSAESNAANVFSLSIPVEEVV